MSHRNGTCAKCGSGDVHRSYQPALTRDWESHRWCRQPSVHIRRDEHLDYHCRSCHYKWEEDCLEVEVEEAMRCPECSGGVHSVGCKGSSG